MYSPQVLDHFEHPRNVGVLEPADAAAQLENPACGDILQLTLKIADGVIREARFRAKGCVPAIACGSRLTEMICGHTVAQAQAIKRGELVASLGGLPEASSHAGHLAIDTLRAALRGF